jgi:hypothetical protein
MRRQGPAEAPLALVGCSRRCGWARLLALACTGGPFAPANLALHVFLRLAYGRHGRGGEMLLYGEPVGTATERPIIVSQSAPYTQILLQ